MSQTLRILIIDDNPDDRTLAIRELNRTFPELDVEEIGDAEGLDRALATGNFDLVVTDYNLRWNDGLTVLRTLKAIYPDRPVIMFTNSGSEEIAVEAMKAGLDDYVLKSPKHYIRLSSAVRLAWERAKTKAILARLESQHQLAEVELRKANERFYLAAAAVNSMIYDWDLERNFVERTQGLTEVLGYLPEEVEATGEWWHEQIHPEDRQRTQAEFQEALARMSSFMLEYRVRHKNNYYLDVWDRGLIVRNAAGTPIRVVGSTIDISERKRLEKSLQQQAQELAQANSLKDEFLAIVSHELRTPLNAMLGWIQILRNRNLSPAKTAQALETIERNARLQAQLVEDLLDVSRLIRGKVRLNVCLLNLQSVVEEAINSVQPLAEAKEITIISIFAPKQEMVEGDPGRLQQVIWNLLTNAIKFTPMGGRVEVRVGSTNSWVQLQVKDTGIGINPDFLPHVFDHFRQAEKATTRSNSGLGLGLAIVRQLVELHGGKVQADSAGIGQGATFTIWLPSCRLPFPPQALPMQPVESLAGLQILVVDDELDTREILAIALEEYGAKVITAASMKEAFAALATSPVDILVSDIGMPEADGYMLIRQMRTLEAKQGKKVIPAIALTAYVREEDRQKAIVAGFQEHVAKPVEPSALAAIIANLVDRNQIHSCFKEQ